MKYVLAQSAENNLPKTICRVKMCLYFSLTPWALYWNFGCDPARYNKQAGKFSSGQTIATCQHNISQLTLLAQHVAHVWSPLRHVTAQIWPISNLSQQQPTCCDTSQHGGQTHPTCCAQQCCDMLCWHVAIVWPGVNESEENHQFYSVIFSWCSTKFSKLALI